MDHIRSFILGSTGSLLLFDAVHAYAMHKPGTKLLKRGKEPRYLHLLNDLGPMRLTVHALPNAHVITILTSLQLDSTLKPCPHLPILFCYLGML